MQRNALIAGIVLILAVFNARGNAYAQNTSTSPLPSQSETNSLSGGDHSSPQFQIWRNGELIAAPNHGDAAMLEIIVEFHQPPLLAQANSNNRATAKSSALQSIQSEHSRFEEDLRRLINESGASASKAAGISTKQHFTRAYNGVAMSVPQWMARQIQSLDYVKRVVKDGEMFASALGPIADLSLSTAARRINAGVTLGGTGEGIRIAIIDTGIDYTHPALGGGFGEAFKVTQGYDFVNDDADPLDDNGHGTHVAGIAGGADVDWQGVAPGAELYAYKVLDQDGAGRDTWVLAAIERALDPDQNPATDDAVDIINLSLGGSAGGDSQNPVTLAVENAIKAGVVCVVAAGNAGYKGKATIAAPGNALTAITVGAITDEGHVAPFSAQGPTGSVKSTSLPRFGVKPDLFAPGVAINSTWLDGTFKEMDGTSMATPHMAGMAARILQSNENWSPAQVKAALVQLADEEGKMPWLQEDGRVNVLPAKELSVLMTPSRFDFGLVDVSHDVWSHSDTLTLHNFDDEAKSYDLTSFGDYPGSVDLTFSSTSVTIQPGESQSVSFTITGPFASLPKKAFPNAYMGTIEASASDERLSIPFSFFNPGQARLSLKESADVLFLLGGEEGHEFSFFDTAGEVYLFLPDDRYDAIVQFGGGSHIVVKEDIFGGGALETSIAKSDAVHKVLLDPLDIHEKPLMHVSGMHAITHKASGFSIVKQGGFLSMAATLPAVQHFSGFGEGYKVEIKATGFSEAGDYYELPFGIDDGITGDVLLANAPEEMTQVNYHYSVPEAHDKLYFVPWSYNTMGASRRSAISAKLDLNEGSPFILYPPFNQSVYLMASPSAAYSWQGHFHTLHTEDFSLYNLATHVSEVTLLETDEIRVMADGSLQIGHDNPVTYDAGQPLDLYPGEGLMRWAGQMDNSSTKIKFKEASGGGYFINEQGDLDPRSFSLKIFAGEEQILADSLFNVPNLPVARWLGESQVSVEPGAYKVILEDTFASPGGWFSRAEAVLEFRTDLADANPPKISQVFITSDGKPARVLHPARSHAIEMNIEEVCSWCTESTEVAHVKLEIRAAQDSLWKPLELVSTGTQLRAALPEGLKEAFYAMRITASDASDNKLTYTLEPAFELGVSQVPFLQEPVMSQEDVGLSPIFTWQSIQDAEFYQIQLAADEAFTQILHEKEAPAMTKVLLASLEEGQRYYWRVRAKTMTGYMPWSQPSWFDTVSNVTISGGETMPDAFQLDPVFPNPVRHEASVAFSIPEVSTIKLEVFDLLGRRVQVLDESMRPAGRYVQRFNTAALAEGTYIIRIQAGSFIGTHTFVKM
ncbi:MAG: S8 family serine peptidase [Rhodothermales bacterium]